MSASTTATSATTASTTTYFILHIHDDCGAAILARPHDGSALACAIAKTAAEQGLHLTVRCSRYGYADQARPSAQAAPQEAIAALQVFAYFDKNGEDGGIYRNESTEIYKKLKSPVTVGAIINMHWDCRNCKHAAF